MGSSQLILFGKNYWQYDMDTMIMSLVCLHTIPYQNTGLNATECSDCGITDICNRHKPRDLGTVLMSPVFCTL